MADESTNKDQTPEEATEQPTAEQSTDTTAVADAGEQDDAIEQKVEVEDVGPACKLITIEIPESRISEKIDSNYEQLQSDTVVPGFRRGRAPMRLIQKRFGSAVRDDAKGQLISESYSKAIEDNNLDVIGEPDVKDIDDLELPESGPMTIKIEVEITPTVELPDLSAISVTRHRNPVTDHDVQEMIDRLTQRHGRPESITDGEIAEGDFLSVEATVLAGKDADDDAEQLVHFPQTYSMVNGESAEHKGHVAGIVVDDLGKRMVGKPVGHVERISMDGPSGHEDERIKDQPITLVVKVLSIERVQPAKEEEVAEQMGVESVDELRERVQTMLTSQREQEETSDLHSQVTEELMDRIKLELPEGMTGRQSARLLQQRRLQMLQQGTPEQEVEAQLAELRERSEEDAIAQLKQFFILDAAAKQLDVEVTQAEINGQVYQMAMARGRRPEKLRQELQKNGELEMLFLQAREQKTLAALLEQMTVVDEQADDAHEQDDAGDEKAAKKKTTKKTTTKKAAAKSESDDADDDAEADDK